MTVIARSPIRAKRNLVLEREEPLVLENIRWSTYQALLRDLGDRPIHLTYDQGTLEIMTLSAQHEIVKTLFGRIIEELTLELDIPVRSLGSTTIARKELKRGLEPDECYYIGRESLVRRMEFDFKKDPPPDLAIEVDVSRSSISRQRVYAALGVPEVWRFDGELHVLHLQANGEYLEQDRSLGFPFLPMAQLETFIHQIRELDENTLIRNFRHWVQKEVLPKYKPRKR